MFEVLRLTRRHRLGLLILAVGIGVVVLGGWYRARSRPDPGPNGWDDLSTAGVMIRDDRPNPGDLAKADLAAVRPFLAANRPALDRMRIGLARESVASFEDSQAGLEKLIDDLGRIRALSRLTLGLARVEEADGRILEASRACRETLALGRAASQGSLRQGVTLGSVLQSQAVDQLRKLRDRLPADECRLILREVEALERRRGDVDAVGSRLDRWVEGSYSPWQRMMLRWSGMRQKGRATEMARAKKFDDRGGRKVRFFLVELAVHAHFLDRKTWPRSVESLVPAYLASVPIDRATGKPIEYPRSPAGDLTDDLGAIARPDGEVSRPSP